MRATLIIAFSLASALPLVADVDYVLIPCQGASGLCAGTGTHRQPTPDQLVGLNDQAFYDYFKHWVPSAFPSDFQLRPGSFSPTIEGSTASGLVIGNVFGPNSIVTSYVFRNGEVLCCSVDMPFSLNDINQNGFMVGYNPGMSYPDSGPDGWRIVWPCSGRGESA